MSIAEGMLQTLQDCVDGLKEGDLKDKGLHKAIEIDETVQSRTQQGDETLMELRRLGLIERKGIGNAIICLSSEGQDALSTIERVGRQKYFFDLLYEKEPLFKQFVDMMRRRGKLSDEEALEISGINKVKISFIKSILKQLPTYAQINYREGKKSYVRYVRNEPVSSLEIRKAIVKKYSELQASSLFVEIDALWRGMQTEFPDISEELFDRVLLDLANQYIGRVELIQGVASPNMKLLFDKRSHTYFHYLKVPQDILDGEIRSG